MSATEDHLRRLNAAKATHRADLVDCLTLFEPSGRYTCDHFIAFVRGSRGGLMPVGNVVLPRRTTRWEEYPRRVVGVTVDVR